MSANNLDANSAETNQGFSKEGLVEFNVQFHKLVDDGKLAN
jgi:hypothetical protein